MKVATIAPFAIVGLAVQRCPSLFSACALLVTAGSLAGQAGNLAPKGVTPAGLPPAQSRLVTGPTWTYTGSEADERAGYSLAILGDVNGDSHADLLLGAPGHDGLLADTGLVGLFLGSPTGLSATMSWSFAGETAGERAGAAVAPGGDVNGDGYADALVGAVGAKGPGVVRAFYGGPGGLPLGPSWSALGEQDASGFGSVLAGVGDINGDGYGDVLVGAPTFDGDQQDQGRVYLYMGSAAGLGLTPAWSAEGEQLGMMLGSSLAAAGNVNGDEFSDFAVGAWSFDTGVPDAGQVAVFLGAPGGPLVVPDWTMQGGQEGERFGCAIATAGDTNGDGYSDLVVGAEKHTGAATEEGAVMVFQGSALGLPVTPDATILGGEPSTHFGVAICGAGDVNNDGLGDFIVGAPRFPNNGAPSGRVFLFLGNEEEPVVEPSWIALGFQAISDYGQALAGVGDLNGDGYCDLVIGAPLLDDAGANVGRSYAYFGAAESPSVAPSTAILEEMPYSFLGGSVCDAGDVNGDGFSDILAGAFYYSSTLPEVGKVYLYYGARGGLQQEPAWTLEGTQEGMQLGRSVAPGGDVNGDGFSDIVVGAWTYDGSLEDEGAAFVFHGSEAGPATSPSWMALGHQEYAQFGWSVAGAGDVNGDGYSDVIVGADQAGEGDGRAFLFLGSEAGLAFTPSWETEQNQVGAGMGGLVASAGDVNGDGYGDVLVDAYGYDVPGQPDENRGRLYLFNGGPTGLSNTPSWTRDGDRVADNFGYTAGSAGDVNGDGFSDIIIGALGYEPARAYVHHGSIAGISTIPDWTFDCDQQNTGLRVARAGDLNGDGYGDVVIGLFNYTANLVGQGRSYLFFGEEAGVQATPTWTSDGDSEVAYFGLAVASGGDVNGDGYGDVLVGSLSGFGVYNGNNGNNPAFTASQRHSTGEPIDLFGRPDRYDGFTIAGSYTLPELNYPSLNGAVVHGWLEWEVSAPGMQFDGVPEGRGAAQQLATDPNLFYEDVIGLFGGVLYSWRARIVTDSPFLPPTAWFSIQGRAASEPELRVGLRRARPASRPPPPPTPRAP